MAQNSYQCSCGKILKTAQGLAGHRRFCGKYASKQNSGATNISETAKKLTDLQEEHRNLLKLHSATVSRLDNLEKIVNTLTRYVCPTGANFVGTNNYRIFELSEKLAATKKEILEAQVEFAKMIKVWVLEVLTQES